MGNYLKNKRDIIIIHGNPYAVLYKDGDKGYYCYFCGFHHFHGDIDGHRVAHCHDKNGRRIKNIKKTITLRNGEEITVCNDHGYFIKASPIGRKI